MSTLHIFAKPLSHYCTNTLANLIAAEDTILLVSDACYSSTQFKQFSSALYLLNEDATARNISISLGDIAIDYTQFVEMTLNTKNTITW
ncbi:sulfurtransferase complex subunit TusB [Pseudoalteromonas sp. SSMSWG5]|jgi:tRNA 2-thiouridine synthesizing protein B|uniref:sulfurtransferase complex subunit TusB n=1 Tax=Pseudoalteromonas TaxID=53246 RepID=UPI000C69D8EF|nr:MULTISPECIES: sulfurtransferase complex subunit TusB [unclassified Pseudoalteromonas]MBU75357.1 sulfurtransferase complex subunit TusB [Pseudoalteromonadaceae bacterium]MEC8208687.1 sulfurtransferase complex subunit TusB [Pseudomonadota bacterium]HCV01625.1 sulfurtransferase complex subunit TusB [Pseudoalteromonas sp.]MCF2900746.1 sulfurtransferase complex subunit TusB [Pseudoalteromonas sp. OFAV1]MCF2919794.1 sulfurtransferase complex subunit TusB [Pseudoalteromonas sp. APAL1]|tara:strand:+ start:240 stop:506 length:267 start_codon:yes stop_codon:yes gene_type:complete